MLRVRGNLNCKPRIYHANKFAHLSVWLLCMIKKLPHINLVEIVINRFNNDYYMTIFASDPEREVQQFDWLLSRLELAILDRRQRKF